MTNPEIQLYHSIPVNVTPEKVIQSLRTSGGSNENLTESAVQIYQHVKEIWSPAAVICWLSVRASSDDSVILTDVRIGKSVTFTMNHSTRFMTPAKSALLAAYTVGPELHQMSRQATTDGRYLDAYIIDQIGMIVLDEISSFIKTLVEKKSALNDWKVGPFLSPGSVHGWELTDQSLLCTFLPIEKINLSCDEYSVLQPFTSLSCLIGIGPDYTSSTVGSTCDVCSKRNDCRIKSESSL